VPEVAEPHQLSVPLPEEPAVTPPAPRPRPVVPAPQPVWGATK
jgi:hypothetical protein